MAATKRDTAKTAETMAKLDDGHYDRVLAQFEAQIEEAAAVLRRALEAMKAENTLRS